MFEIDYCHQCVASSDKVLIVFIYALQVLYLLILYKTNKTNLTFIMNLLFKYHIEKENIINIVFLVLI